MHWYDYGLILGGCQILIWINEAYQDRKAQNEMGDFDPEMESSSDRRAG